MVTNYFCYPIKAWSITHHKSKTFVEAVLPLSIEQAPAAVKQAILRQDLAIAEKLRRRQIEFYQAYLEHPVTKTAAQIGRSSRLV